MFKGWEVSNDGKSAYYNCNDYYITVRRAGRDYSFNDFDGNEIFIKTRLLKNAIKYAERYILSQKEQLIDNASSRIIEIVQQLEKISKFKQDLDSGDV